jgi:hypothetical protein
MRCDSYAIPVSKISRLFVRRVTLADGSGLIPLKEGQPVIEARMLARLSGARLSPAAAELDGNTRLDSQDPCGLF